MRTLSPPLAALLVPALGVLAACTQNQANALTGCTDTASSAIVGGSPATAYPEAALVDMLKNGQVTAACSGSIIAPKVVLTAGHCVDGFTGWHIKAPFAGNQTASAASGETYDWAENGATTVNPNHHDIGLVYLSTPITLTEYPVLSQQKVSNATNIVNIGRIDNGTFSTTSLFVSAPVSISDATNDGFPFDYVANEIIQSGDSGGPDELIGANPHMIVAVNSGAGTGTEVLARVDLLYTWIQQRITAHGGGGGGSGAPSPPDAGTGTGGGGGSGGAHDAGSSGGKRDASAPPSGGDPGSTDGTTNQPTQGGSTHPKNPCAR